MAFAEGINGNCSPRNINVVGKDAVAALEQGWIQYKEGLELKKQERSPAVGAKLQSRHLSFADNPTSAFSFPFDWPNRIPPQKACILSIDGGGTDSLIPARILCYLEQTLQKKTGNPNARIADFFDIFAGTNIGGFIATMLCTDDGKGRPLFSAEQATKIIAEECGNHKLKVLPPRLSLFSKLSSFLSLHRRSRSHQSSSTAVIERILRRHLIRDGQKLTLRDTIRPILIPCYDMSSAGAFLFSRADAMRCESFDFTLAEVCRATAAVPAMLEPAKMSSVDGKTSVVGVDGALVMNNPAAMAVTHVLHNAAEFPYVRNVGDTLVLSIGTGLEKNVQRHEHDQVKKWGLAEWAHPVARIVLDGIADMVDHFMSMAFRDHRNNYVRIQAAAGGSWRATDEKVAAAPDVLEQPCMEHIPFGGKRQLPVSNRQRLDLLADCLVAEQRARACQAAIQTFF